MSASKKAKGHILVVVAWGVGFAWAGTSKAEWKGHLAGLRDAQIACRDIDSVTCQPFMAEAVAVADLLDEQSKAGVGGEAKTLLPGSNMSVWVCDDQIYERLNGESLMHIALAISTPENHTLYWTQALRAAALQQCKPTK